MSRNDPVTILALVIAIVALAGCEHEPMEAPPTSASGSTHAYVWQDRVMQGVFV